ncbi:ABC transporter permease [Microbacterium sp. No. 7]|uniref:ABC transporter permease n=1 Tax=Microbacterium sp. No. 7 TaxID=1714373 RepID=UPI0006D1CF5C|nr:ABC transporter permease [Microbacterium sp. No. 7]ALJ20071.1 ABC transporter permease [Microbacterium sp. No. 7]
MIGYLLRRIGMSVLLLFVVTLLTYVMVFSGGRNIAARLAGLEATDEMIEARLVQLGLDQPVLQSYFQWAIGALQGDLGTSWFTSEPVTSAILSRLPVTLSLVIVTIVLSAILAVALGMAAAVRRGWADRVVQVLAIVGYAVPGFIIAMLLVTLFAINWRIFPATGYVPIEQGLGGWAWSLVLPVTALVVGTVAATAQQVRGALIDVLRRDYVRTLRSRGIGEREILWKHVLRSAAPPGLTILSLQIIGLLSGSVIVEQIFNISGMGYLAVQSTARGDIPIIQGVVTVTILIVVIVNFAIDLAVAWLNPKARLS